MICVLCVYVRGGCGRAKVFEWYTLKEKEDRDERKAATLNFYVNLKEWRIACI